MAITAIKRLYNERERVTILVENKENPGKVGNRVPLGFSYSASGFADCDIWIPWCATEDDFLNGHFIEVSVYGPPVLLQPPDIWGNGPLLATYRVWQAAHADGDFVRFSAGLNGVVPSYVVPGQTLDGDATVGGDRALKITQSGIQIGRFG